MNLFLKESTQRIIQMREIRNDTEFLLINSLWASITNEKNFKSKKSLNGPVWNVPRDYTKSVELPSLEPEKSYTRFGTR